MRKVKTLLMINWGIGHNVLLTLMEHTEINIKRVITHSKSNNQDPWYNYVFDACIEYNIPYTNEIGLDWADLKQIIIDEEIELVILHAFMRILPADVINIPKYGVLNIHPSYLPNYPGKDPTSNVLKNGDNETGLTLHQVDEGVDTGQIISQVKIPVFKGDNRVKIIERMKEYVPLVMVGLTKHINNKK